jgi:tRNA wybutosine-synthesizing protein 3
MVTPEYVRYLVQVANEKMEANRNRTERFLRLLQSNESMIEDSSNRLSPTNGVELVCDHLQLDDQSQLTNGNAPENQSGIFLKSTFFQL